MGVTVTETSWSWRYQTGVVAWRERSETETLPGTVTTIEVVVQDEAFAMRLPNLTAPGAPNPVPRMVTLVPT